jgi:protein SCO1/2
MRLRRYRAIFVAGVAIASWGVSSAQAQLADRVPEALEEVGVSEHLSAKLPLDLEFRDENGNWVELGSFFDGERPVILTLNYYRCPMLCGLMLNGLAEGLGKMAWMPGEEFEIVTISIDPLETPELARAKKQNYLKFIDKPGVAEGWHFMTGRELEINRLAETLGFSYTYDPKSQEYAHPAVMFVCTPDGRVARYLYGIEYPAKRLKLALLEAAEGTVGSTLDQLILYCYHYDPTNRRYTPVAMNIMRVGGGATALILGVVLGIFWIREWRRKKNTEHKETAA